MLAFHAHLELGELAYDQHSVALCLRRGILPIVDRLDVTLPRDVRFEATFGDPVALKLDGGEGESLVFTGKVSAIRRGLRDLRVSACNGGFDLARYRPSLAIEQVSVGDIVKRLCGDVELDCGVVDDGPKLALYVADGRATALDEITRLARHLGAIAAVDGENKLHCTSISAGAGARDLALRYGREILAVELERLAPDTAELVVVGEGAGASGSPKALWPIADFYQGQRTEPGPGAKGRAEPELRTVDDAKAASAAWTQRRAMGEQRVRLNAWLIPELAPGARIEIQELPESIDLSALRVRQVVHRVDARRGAFSQVWASEDVGSDLLGQLLGAIGGLL